MTDINHQTHLTRLSQLTRLTQAHNLQTTNITPLAYQPLGPCPYNNFIYKLELTHPPDPYTFHNPESPNSNPDPNPKLHPYISPLPNDEKIFVLRMNNPLAMGINPLSDRIENEILAMGMARKGLDTLRDGLGGVVPRVYAYCARPEGVGELPWVLMEYKAGVALDEVFGGLEGGVRGEVLGQVADLVAGLRLSGLGLSRGVEGVYGGLGVRKDGEGDGDEEGGIVGTEMTMTRGGPWKSYERMLQARLRHELGDAEQSPVINGWRENGVKERLDSLIEKFTLGEELGLGLEERVLVHGDLSKYFTHLAIPTTIHSSTDTGIAMNNILISPTTHKLTALLDFDFACIAHPAHEFLVSLQDLGGNIMGPYGEDPTQGKLSAALLSGDFSEEVPGTLWWTGKTFNEMLKDRGVKRPCDMMPGMEVLRQWRALEQLICPFHLAAPFIVQRMSEEQRAGARAAGEEELVAQMEALEKVLGVAS
ncbi:phosphotransferase family protein [Aspergillus ibericus CBS 121593]|uniref:Uncharacterized protein n=1 Tax=Aspergillus ibericus CBS 121593 TaxID=1448316 RepID=A0A395H2N0_9EURO|nr:hypothetical protein BO80DRAFT_100047 [Aspergillus ibericus CBS 121593]RAL00484.1 hypothetical protein BO80DRAFT_100047 [Aspergillus ibericus CBS 121593]